MKSNERVSRAALLTIGIGALLGAHTASAAEEVLDEIVVYGTPTALVLDTASLRVDVKQHVRALSRSIRDALAERSSERRVAAAPPRARG